AYLKLRHRTGKLFHFLESPVMQGCDPAAIAADDMVMRIRYEIEPAGCLPVGEFFYQYGILEEFQVIIYCRHTHVRIFIGQRLEYIISSRMFFSFYHVLEHCFSLWCNSDTSLLECINRISELFIGIHHLHIDTFFP